MNDFDLKIGLSAAIETKVFQKDTAEEVGSGSIDVFATPSMIALMEKVALAAVELHLPAGYCTVGTMINIRHCAATPVGMKVRAEAELVNVEGKKLLFRITAYDGFEKIGEGEHERCIVNKDRFREKAYGKLG